MILGKEDPVEKEYKSHSSILAWVTHNRKSMVGLVHEDPKSRHNLETKQQQVKILGISTIIMKFNHLDSFLTFCHKNHS